MICLPDVNVWVALAVDIHPHHSVAVRWFELQSSVKLVFCRTTEMALLRLLTNPRVMDGAPLTASQAWNVRDRILGDPRILIVSEPEGLEEQWRRASRAGRVGPNFWTDAYLVAFCTAANYTLVTFDRALAARRGCRTQLLT